MTHRFTDREGQRLSPWPDLHPGLGMLAAAQEQS